MEIYIDATDAVVGRIGTYAAKQALLGHTVKILNAEKAIFTGDPKKTVSFYHNRIFGMGTPFSGPFYSRLPDRFLRRVLRGMFDYKNPRGAAAYKRLMCYVGVPTEFKDKKMITVGKKAEELPTLKYVSVGKLCKSIGGKV